MSEMYFSARELAEMALPEMPSTTRGVDKKAKTDAWEYVENPGRGGGRLYSLSNFSPEMRAHILACRTGAAAPAGLYVPSLSPRDAALRSKALRGDAILFICSRFGTFRAHHGLSVRQAECLFANQFEVEKNSGQYQWFADWIFAVLPTFSVQSLRRWRAASSKDPKNVYAKYNNRRGACVLETAENGRIKNAIVALISHKPHIRPGHVRDYIRAEYGAQLKIADKNGSEKTVDLPHVRSFERFLAKWKKDNASVFLKIADPDAWKNHHMMALGNASADVHRLNQLWEIDASPADVLLSDGRYSIYAVIDVWSRRALFSASKTACSDASLMLVRRAILEWGVPEVIKTDNGADFVSHRFVSALQALRIGHMPCRPHTPEGKPHVERVIRTMQHDLMELLPGYVGHNVKERQQLRARKAFAQRLGEAEKETFSVALDHKKLQELMDIWALQKYARRKHSTLGISPFQKAAGWDASVQIINNIRALDLLLAPLAGTDGFRTIGKKGLRIDNGVFYGPDLELFVGQRVFVRHDPEDMGRVFVFTEDQAFICEALNQDRLGAHPAQAAAEAKARQKKFIAEETKDIRRIARTITPETVAEKILSASARDSAGLAQFPHRGEAHEAAPLTEAARAFEKTPLERERSAAELAAHEAFVADFNRQQAEAGQTPQSDEDRWWEKRKSLLLKDALCEPLTADERGWLEMTETMPWCVSRQNFEALRSDFEE